MLDYDIIDFWKWFKENSNKLQSDHYDHELLHKLDHTISEWGLGWEIGPGVIKRNSFTISPNGRKDLLDQTLKILRQAPLLNDWEFYSTKQPKENWSKAKILDIGLEVEASNRTYVLLKYPDDKIEILIKADNLTKLNADNKELAVDLILTNLLGEKRKIEEIDFVDIVDEFESNTGVTKLQFLPAHLAATKNGA